MIRQIGEIDVRHDVEIEPLRPIRWSRVRRQSPVTMPSWEPSPAYDLAHELREAMVILGTLHATLGEYPIANAEALKLQLRALQHVVRARAAYQYEQGACHE